MIAYLLTFLKYLLLKPEDFRMTDEAGPASPAAPFSCEECGAGFADRLALAAHSRAHRRGPLACPGCDRTFRLPGELRRHRRVHGPDGGEQGGPAGDEGGPTRPPGGEAASQDGGGDEDQSVVMEARVEEEMVVGDMAVRSVTEQSACGLSAAESVPAAAGDAPGSIQWLFQCVVCAARFDGVEGLKGHMHHHDTAAAADGLCGGGHGSGRADSASQGTSNEEPGTQRPEEPHLAETQPPIAQTGRRGVSRRAASRLASDRSSEASEGSASERGSSALRRARGMFACGRCPREYRTWRGLLSHSASHGEGSRVTCDSCGQEFGEQRLLELHPCDGGRSLARRREKRGGAGRRRKEEELGRVEEERGNESNVDDPPVKAGEGAKEVSPGAERLLPAAEEGKVAARPLRKRRPPKRLSSSVTKDALSAAMEELTRDVEQDSVPAVGEPAENLSSDEPVPKKKKVASASKRVKSKPGQGDGQTGSDADDPPAVEENGAKNLSVAGESETSCAAELLEISVAEFEAPVAAEAPPRATKEGAEDALKRATQHPFECDLCHRQMAHQAALRRHRLLHVDTPREVFECEVCGRRYTRIDSLVSHCRSHQLEPTHQCRLCYKAFPMKVLLEHHQRNHENCGKRPRAAAHFSCDQCGRQLTHMNALRRHMRLHGGGQTFLCELCPKRYSRLDSLMLHSRVHPDQGHHVCQVCYRVFAQRRILEYHSQCHAGVGAALGPPYTCLLCARTFADEKQLSMHCRQHAVRTFLCDTCGKEFSSAGKLKRHAMTHTGEKPVECGNCGHRFIDAAALAQHARIHSGERPFQCHVCGKNFARNVTLQIHARTHSGEKPYACLLCERRFTTLNQLRRHQRVHSGARPYVCTVCGKAFSQTTHRKVHMRTHLARGEDVLEAPNDGAVVALAPVPLSESHASPPPELHQYEHQRLVQHQHQQELHPAEEQEQAGQQDSVLRRALTAPQQPPPPPPPPEAVIHVSPPRQDPLVPSQHDMFTLPVSLNGVMTMEPAEFTLHFMQQ